MSDDDDDGLDGRRGRKRKPFPKPTERAVTRSGASTAHSDAKAKPSAKPSATAKAKPSATAKPKPNATAKTKPSATAKRSAKPSVSARAKPAAPAKLAAPAKPVASAKPTAPVKPPAPRPAKPRVTARPSAPAKLRTTDGTSPLGRAPNAHPITVASASARPSPEHTRSSPGALAAPRAVRPAGRRSLGPDVQVRPTPAVSSAETRAPRPGPARPPTVRLEHGSHAERETAIAPTSDRAPRPGARAATMPPRAHDETRRESPEPPAPLADAPAFPPPPYVQPAVPREHELAADHGASAPPAIDVPDASLYQVEETIDRFFGDASADDREARRRATEAFAQVAAHLGGAGEQASADGVLDGARELLRPGYYVRQWGRLGLRNRSEEVDDFGLDRAYEARFRPFFESLYRRWFRTSARGLENVPADGRCLIVANHGGALPWDGLMLRTAFRLEHPAHRELRWLAEDFVSHAPFLGAFVQRVGAVRACPENAERLLAQGKLVAVFPEGEKGVGKPFRERYELQRFGRGGYIKLALRTKTPIVPTAIIGSEEAHPLLFRTAALARLAGLPFLPVTPTFPWLGPLGLVPLPSRWVILCGEPIDLEDAHGGAADPEDPIAVARLNDRVRAAVQDLVRRALDLRERPF